jgi:hypothetical protein
MNPYKYCISLRFSGVGSGVLPYDVYKISNCTNNCVKNKNCN